MPPIQFRVQDATLIVTGNTFPIKDDLKSLNGTWSPALRAWSLPLIHDTPEMRAALLQKGVKSVTPVPYADVIKECLKKKATTGEFYWICCESCKVVDWKRMHTDCHACAIDGNSFRVRGNIYTGD